MAAGEIGFEGLVLVALWTPGLVANSREAPVAPSCKRKNGVHRHAVGGMQNGGGRCVCHMKPRYAEVLTSSTQAVLGVTPMFVRGAGPTPSSS